MVPGTVHYTYSHKVQLNSLGFRGPELGAISPSDHVVLALGDSMIYGQGVADDETVPSAMERFLNLHKGRHGAVYHVVNAGVRAYSTNQELGVLKEIGPKIKPSTVVLFWYWNDVEETAIDRRYSSLEQRGPVVFDLKAPAKGWPLWKWRGLQLLRKSALLVWARHLTNGLRAVYPDERQIATAMNHLDGYLAEFNTLAEQWKFRFFVAVIPDPTLLVTQHPSEVITARVKQVASRRGVQVIDVLAPLQGLYFRSNRRLPVIRYDGHFNGVANRVIAETVSQAILRE